MAHFEKGTIIKTDFGAPITIIEHLAGGGQGEVYLVEFQGERKALKWYKKTALHNPKAFYQNLKANVERGSIHRSFLWPLAVTEVVDGTFGYIMDLRPEGYYDLSKIFNTRKCNFSSFRAATDACIAITNAFRLLHNEGYSYQDLNDGNFFVNPENGKVLICDNDNVAPNGTNTGVLGTPRYMAPEIVAGCGKVLPNTQTDRYSLATILFMILFMNHPLEGIRYFERPCITDDFAQKLYGSMPLFIFDPDDSSNRACDKNSPKRWKLMPDYIKNLFLEAFSQSALKNPSRRLREYDWLKVLTRFRSEIVSCPCGNDVFVKGDPAATQCEDCRKPLPIRYSIKLPEYTMAAAEGSRVYRCQLGICNPDEALNPVALVVAKPDDPTVLGLKNMTGKTLTAQTPSGRIRQVMPKEVVPFKAGIRIDVFDKQISLLEN